jgi:hypothetical protein
MATMCRVLPYIIPSPSGYAASRPVSPKDLEEREMDDPLRVLVVERRHADRWIAQVLLSNYDLDFSWQCVASPLELRPSPSPVFRPSGIAVGESLVQ